MRAFVAVDVPEPSEELTAGSEAAPAHLTLAFLGEVDASRGPALASAVDRAAAAVAPFDLVLQGVGAFPDVARPRIVFVGVGEGRPSLERLAAAVRLELGRERFPVDARPFVPHLTVLRVRSPEGARRAHELVGRLASATFARARISEVVVKSSVLGPGGARHAVEHASPLVGAGATPGA